MRGMFGMSFGTSTSNSETIAVSWFQLIQKMFIKSLRGPWIRHAIEMENIGGLYL